MRTSKVAVVEMSERNDHDGARAELRGADDQEDGEKESAHGVFPGADSARSCFRSCFVPRTGWTRGFKVR